MRRQPLMIVKEFEQRHGSDSNFDGGNFFVSVCLLPGSTVALEARGWAAVPIALPAAIHGAIRSVQQQPPDFIGIAEGDGDGDGDGDGWGTILCGPGPFAGGCRCPAGCRLGFGFACFLGAGISLMPGGISSAKAGLMPATKSPSAAMIIDPFRIRYFLLLAARVWSASHGKWRRRLLTDIRRSRT